MTDTFVPVSKSKLSCPLAVKFLAASVAAGHRVFSLGRE
jgi:hypothetical protein